MNYISFIIKFLYRIRYWLIFLPLAVGVITYVKTQKMSRDYTAYSTIYTGLITGTNILSESGMTVAASTQNSMMDNLLNIITSDQTLKNVSLRLYARSMVYGPKNDPTYISKEHYEHIYNHGKEIHHLIDRSSPNDSINEENTYRNLLNYEKNDRENYVYGIYRFYLPYFNRNALKKIEVERDGKSDMLEVSYTTDDPGIAYQTLRLLNDEFIKQYQELRFGETNNVIAYFEKELARVAAELRAAEDSLTIYSIEQQVINYEEETKQIAVLSKEYELGYWSAYRGEQSSKRLRDELEKRININAEVFKTNSDFLRSMEKMSSLNQQLVLPHPYSEDKPLVGKDSIRQRLLHSEDQFDAIVSQYGKHQNSKEGIANNDIVNEWLGQLLSQEKSMAELEAMKKNKDDLTKQYAHYSPIGSTLTRKERAVNISEQEYFSIMTALNNARLRQKSLLMTSATLKVMNEPVYPVSPLDSNRKKITIGLVLATFIFILFFFLLVELLDRTLRDKMKVAIITGGQTAGAFTRFFRAGFRRYNQVYAETSAKNLGHFTSTYFKPEKNNIINIISNMPGEGKSFVAEQLAAQFKAMGMEVKRLSWHDKFEMDTKSFIQSLDLPNLDIKEKSKTKENVILVEYPSLKEASLTHDILKGVSVNLLVVDARRTWQSTDQIIYERVKDMSDNTPLFFVLNHTGMEAAEDFNGFMPPYTLMRRFFYRLSQLGLTSSNRIS